MILIVECIIIVIVSVIDYMYHSDVNQTVLGLILVVAMGMQNFLHHYYKGPMTTVMTGNIVHWSVSIMCNFFNFNHTALSDVEKIRSLVIISFGVGCVTSGITTTHIGLASCIIPGAVLLFLLIKEVSYTRVIKS